MNIEKTFKLTIKDTSFYLDATEINALYNECGKALNIGNTNPSYPPGVTKQPSDYPNWPTYPYPTYCGDMPFGTTDHSVMDWHNYHSVTGTGISTANVPSSKGINFLSDDMETIKENDKWRSSVQQALDKLSVKNDITTSDGTTIR
jgi:hypothetical protein